MRRAQITLFIVLGIVVLIIFGLFFFISGRTSNVALEKKVNKVYSDFLSSSNIENIADSCLDKTTRDALLLVGLQGGRIYDYQINGGYHIPSFYDVIPFNYTTERNPNGTIYNVSYGIKAPRAEDLPYPYPPNYPYPGSLIKNPVLKFDPSSEYSDSSYAHLFLFQNQSLLDEDRPILPQLCNMQGANYYNVVGAGWTCETFYSSTNKSVQEYIQQYLEQNVEDCINLTVNATSKYNISVGELSSLVLLGEDDLLISIRYPIEISIKNKPPITKHLEFNIRPKVKLKTLYLIASHLIGKYIENNLTTAEADNIFFDITKDDSNDCYTSSPYDTVPCIIDGIKIIKLPDYCLNSSHHCNFDEGHYDYSDILIIEDNTSIIDGKPYRFQFAIENRRPALDFIDENVSSDEYYYWYINSTYGKNLTEVYSKTDDHQICNDCNIILKSLNTLEIFPLGIDPDEDNLTYKYTVKYSPSPFNWDNSNFEGSFYYTNGVPGRRYVSGFVSDHNIGKDIMIGSVPSPPSPPGYADNRIIINVSDNEGLYDYQEVLIRVTP